MSRRLFWPLSIGWMYIFRKFKNIVIKSLGKDIESQRNIKSKSWRDKIEWYGSCPHNQESNFASLIGEQSDTMYLLIWCETYFSRTYQEILSKIFILNLMKLNYSKFKKIKKFKSQHKQLDKSIMWDIL